MHGSLKRISAAAVSALLLLSGCSGGNGSDAGSAPAEKELVRLTIWSAAEEQDMLVELCENYARAHPEKRYAFTLGAMTDAEAAEQLLSENGERADVFCFSSRDTERLVQAGALFRVTTDRGLIAESCSADAILSAEASGELYGYPFSADTCVLYYNKSKLTPEEAASLDLLLEKNLPDIELNLAMDLTDGRQLAGFFMGSGCSPFGEECRFNGDNGMLAAEYLLSLVRSPKFAGDFGSSDVKAGFADGTLAAAVADLKIAPEIKSSLGGSFGAVMLPQFTLPDGRTAQLGGAADYRLAGVSARSAYPADAMEFARLLADYEVQEYRLRRFDTPPANRALSADEDILSACPEIRALNAQLSSSRLPRSQGFLAHAADFGQSLIDGRVTLNNLRERLNRFAELALAAG